jgi:nitrate/nitrite transporter NarK
LWRLNNIQGFASAILGSMVYFGASFLLPFFLTQQDKFSYYHAGFLLAAVSGSSMLASPMSGYGSDRWGGLWVCRLGSLVLLGAALFLFLALKGASTPELLGHFVFLGIGYALFYTPAFNSILRPLPPDLARLVAGTNSFMKNLGYLLGVVLVVIVGDWGRLGGQSIKTIDYHWAFGTVAGIAFINLLLNFWRRPQS